MKIVVNINYGGFDVSPKVLTELGFPKPYTYLCNLQFGIESDNDNAYRADPRLINAIEKIGLRKSAGPYNELKIVEIPDDVDWEIYEYDGIETIHEKHRVWK